MNKRTLALLAALAATTIYGLNHTIAKGVMPTYVKPFGFILVRLIGATALFWGISFFVPKQRIARKDWGRFAVCALFGMGINMLAFFKGLELSTPINSSVLVTLTPIVTVVVSVFLIKEKVTRIKGVGIFLGLIGALTLVLFGAEIRADAPNIPLGNMFFVVNAIAYGVYLILLKKLAETYHPFVLLKWLFTIGLVINIPFGLQEFMDISWQDMPMDIAAAVAFVVMGTTFCTYLLNAFAVRQLKASTVSTFIYVQPLVGILFALAMGKDYLTVVKVLAGSMVLLGVYLASKKPKS